MDFRENQEIFTDYIEAAEAFVSEMESLLMRLEQCESDDDAAVVYVDLLTQLHTFKGNSGMMGFSQLQRYAHQIEDVVGAMQEKRHSLAHDVIDILFSAVDSIAVATRHLSAGAKQEMDLTEKIARLAHMLHTTTPDPRPETAPARVDPPRSDASARLPQSQVLRVDFARLDALMNLLGELVICRTRLGRIDAHLAAIVTDKQAIKELRDATEHLGKVTTELHEAMMKTRMVPIRRVFARFSRLVRDIAKSRGRHVDLHFTGEDTELDKTVVDEIGDPLVHLLRNAVDHGIESPRERQQRGKPPHGTIHLRACQHASHIVVDVEDDGRGIDLQRLRERARRQKLLDDDDIGRRGINELIFLRGLSTANEVTEVSGRGVGMDVVLKSLTRINGTIHVSTVVGQGTHFSIKLPLTLAIMPVLMVSISDEQYAVPLQAVAESLKIPCEAIHVVNGHEVANIRGHVTTLLRLADTFGLERRPAPRTYYVVVVHGTYEKVGIIVDNLVGQEEIVIKSLHECLGTATGIAGATILGDGRVILIVDVAALTRRDLRQRLAVSAVQSA